MHDCVVAARRGRGYGGRRYSVQGMERSPLVTVSFCDDEDDGRDHAPIPREADTSEWKGVAITMGSQGLIQET